MNVENIKRVRDHIAELPPEQFDMQYMQPDVDADRPDGCGSALCIAGWAHIVLELEGFTADAAAAFGISEAAGFALCWPPEDSFAWHATPAQAVRVLDHLIETGEVDWSVAREAA